MRKKIAIYPGTFDPITLGHVDVLVAGSEIFDQVIVAVINNRNKQPFFEDSFRKKLVEAAIYDFGLPNVSVELHDGLTVNLALKNSAYTIVRGLRLVMDFEVELDQCFNNRLLCESVQTIFIPPKQEHLHIRSSTVRELISYSFNDFSNYLPKKVEQLIKEKLFDK